MTKFFRSPATIPILGVGVVGVLLVLYAWRLPPFVSNTETTDNAYVRGQVTMISPQLSGYVAEVAVQDYQSVKAGDLLVRIDDRIYQQQLAQARASLAAQQASLRNLEATRDSKEANIDLSQAKLDAANSGLQKAQIDLQRVNPLLEGGFAAKSQGDTLKAALQQAQSGVEQAKAGVVIAQKDLALTIASKDTLQAAVDNAQATVRLAEINVQNTRIVAPQAGHLGEVGARVGQYVTAGSQLTSVVPDQIWIVANFKETQIAAMAVGQTALFTVDALGGASLKGKIERFSPAAGSEFSVLKADNATGNFTKVAQRIPVRIAIDPQQDAVDRLRPGMSVVVTVAAPEKAAASSVAAKL